MVDCYYTFLADIRLMGNVIFMVDYIHGLPHTTEMGACMKGLMGLKGFNAGGCPLRLLLISPLGLNFRPSLESTPRRHHEIIFFFFAQNHLVISFLSII